jgi:hypothetical protein
MNHCRKVELFPKDEEIIPKEHNVSGENSGKVNNDVKEISSHVIKTQPHSEVIEKIDVNLIKIVEDIVNKILEKRFPSKVLKSNKFILRKPLTVTNKCKTKENQKSKTANKRKNKNLDPKPKRVKPVNWIYL